MPKMTGTASPKEGIKRLKNLTVAKSEITIWKIYHAMACNRFYSSLWKCTDENTNTKVSNESCCLFMEVVIDLPDAIVDYI